MKPIFDTICHYMKLAQRQLYRYILWTEENVPKGGRDLGMLLERCIKEFQDVAKYESDQRLLSVWLKYVSGGTTFSLISSTVPTCVRL